MMDSCIFCALKELFTQFQYSHESALPPDALRKALAETFFNQQRFQLGFMDDAAECFENILLRIHFHIANMESEDMCNAVHCISHQKFAMTLVEQGVCHACGATSEPLPFSQMVHYISSSALCTQAKLNRDGGDGNCSEQFGKLLRKAGGMGEIRACPSTCGAKIHIHRTLMNRPEIVSIGIVWDSERPTVDHITDVFRTIGTTLRLQDVFHSVVDDHWASASIHQLVGVVTYYGKHYSTFFFHAKLRVWIYFDDAVVREVGPHWEQVVEKCRRGHFQPLLLLYANPYGTPVATESAPKTVTFVPGHRQETRNGCGTFEAVSNGNLTCHRRAVTPNPEVHREPSSDLLPRRAITPNADMHLGNSHLNIKHMNGNHPALHHSVDSDNGYSSADRNLVQHEINKLQSNGYNYYDSHLQSHGGNQQFKPYTTSYNGDFQPSKDAAYDFRLPLKPNGYFHTGDPTNNNCRKPPAAYHVLNTQQVENNNCLMDNRPSDNIYISRKAVENVLNYQKLQRQRTVGSNFGNGIAGSRNSNSSLESFENALRMRGYSTTPYDVRVEHQEPVPGTTINNLPRSRDSGNWSGDRNSASSTSSASMENPYYVLAGNKRLMPPSGSAGFRGYPLGKVDNETGLRAAFDAGYDSFSLSSNDSFPMQQLQMKHNQQLAQIPENVTDPTSKVSRNQGEFIDECQSLCLEADTFLEKSVERENFGDIDGAISLCNAAAAKARAAMDAPYSNPQILAFARMKHNICIMRVRSLHRRVLVRQDSINSHGSSSTSTETDSPRKGDSESTGNHHSRQSSRDSTRSRRESSGNHSRQSSRDGGNHSRQSSRDASHSRQNSQDAAEKKKIELYGTLPKKGNKKKADKPKIGSVRIKDERVMHDQYSDSSFELVPSETTPLDSNINSRVKPKTKIGPSVPVMQTEVETVGLKDRAWYQIADDCGDYPNEWENTRKPTLQRANSIPPNFQQDLANSSSFTDLLGTLKSKDESSKANSTKLGKKQHKIRRKLLMGGLIRRKNCSMPDLREGQNQSPSPESSQRAFDDCSMRKSEQSLEIADKGLRNDHYNISLSHQNLYNGRIDQRLCSSHGKIPPPPPVRTTSQLTTRSQSHGNLISPQYPPPMQQYPLHYPNAFTTTALPTVAPLPKPPVNQHHHLNSTSEKLQQFPSDTQHAQYFQHPSLSVQKLHFSNADGQLNGNTMTIQADVHHERTPSDNIRPVCLVRRASTGGAHAQDYQQRHNMAHPSLVQSKQELKLPFTSGPPVSSSPNAPSINLNYTSQQHNLNPLTVESGSISRSVDEDEPPAGGLLAQLRMKRQQIMENSTLKVQPVTTAKQSEESQQTSGSRNWLQELQAKQQQMLNKKCDVAVNNRVNNEAPVKNDTSVTTQSAVPSTLLNPIKVVKTLGLNGENKSHFSMFGSNTAVAPSPPSKAEIKDGVDYRPKSVRDLANRFEQILLSPPTSSSSSVSTNSQVVSRKDAPEVHAEAKPVTNGYSNQLVSNQYPDNSHGLTVKDNGCNSMAQQIMRPYDRTSTANSQGHCGVPVAKNNLIPEAISEVQGSKINTNGAYKVYDSKSVQGNVVNHLRPNDQNYKSSSRDNVMVGNNGVPYSTSVPHYNVNPFNGWSTYEQNRTDGHQNYAINHQMIGSSNHRPDVCYPQHDSSYGESVKQMYYNSNGNTHNGSYLSSATNSTCNQSDQQEFPPPPPSPLLKQMMGYSINMSNSGVSNDINSSIPNKDKVLPSYNPPPPVGPRGNAFANGGNCISVGLPNATMTNLNFQPSRSPTLATQTTAGVSTEMPKKKKGKKSVTFSDQIALVACADDDGMALPNPLLEKVLHKSSTMTNNNNGPPPKTVFNPLYIHSQVNGDRSNGLNGCATKQFLDSNSVTNMQYVSSSSTPSQLNGNCPVTVGYCNMLQYPPNDHMNGKPKLTGTKVLCSLCGKKTVLPPTIYCVDCDFYMSRFKPKK